MNKIAKTTFLLGFAGLFLIGLALRLEALDAVIFNEWIARDFDRAFNIVDGIYIPLAGPELTNGGRLPGPFMYIFLTIPLLIKYSYHSLFVFNFVLNIVSIIGLFFILKRYFDIYIASITVGLVSISFFSIVAVSLPVNPSFLFPFITIFIGLLLEFALKRNTKVIPYIALTFALAVQFHYSIATYFLIPVVIGLVFRIKVPLKTMLASLIIVIICISPYAIHIDKFFIPSNTDNESTLAKQDFSSPWVNFKVITLLQTFHYFSDIKTHLLGEPQLPKGYSLTMSFFTGMAFYILFLIVVRKYINKDWRSCKKETITLITFWVPALLYGIVNPTTAHLWYGFIFIIPQALILAVIITTIYRHILCRPYKIVYAVVIFLLFTTATLSMNQHTRTVLQGINDKILGNKRIVNGTYNNTQLMLSVLLDELDLRANEFYDRVYLIGYHSLSKRRLEMLEDVSEGNYKKKGDAKSLSCYFIFDESKNYTGAKNRHGRIIDIFQNDKSINIVSSKSLSFSPWGFPEVLKIYQYQPIPNQSCYNNTFNPFVTTKSIRKLLIASKDIIFSGEDIGHKVLSEQIKYDTNNDLDLLSADYAINNKISQSPFNFNLNIVKIGNVYSIKGDMELYPFFGGPYFDIKRMDIVIEKINGEQAVNGQIEKIRKPNIEEYRINILSPQTLANFLHTNKTHLFSYNQRWFREVPTTISLKKKQFNVYLKWILNCGEDDFDRQCPFQVEKEFTLSLYNQFSESRIRLD